MRARVPSVETRMRAARAWKRRYKRRRKVCKLTLDIESTNGVTMYYMWVGRGGNTSHDRRARLLSSSRYTFQCFGVTS
jgi:hypothetical protein